MHSAGDVLQLGSTESGSTLGGFGVDPAVAVVTRVLTALRGAPVGGSSRCLQDATNDPSVGGDGPGQDAVGGCGDVGTVQCRMGSADHVGGVVGHHRGGAGGRVTVQLGEDLQDGGQPVNGEHRLDGVIRRRG
ncbi:MAG: hypothetical protein QOJ06_3376 [Pseudonocardiales bacterium]|nr:hypothetical protein [Pseudonocardiales bacterium]